MVVFPPKDSLHSLVTTLGHANPYFVRCLKPNNEKKKDYFLPETVMNQLKYSGMHISNLYCPLVYILLIDML